MYNTIIGDIINACILSTTSYYYILSNKRIKIENNFTNKFLNHLTLCSLSDFLALGFTYMLGSGKSHVLVNIPYSLL